MPRPPRSLGYFPGEELSEARERAFSDPRVQEHPKGKPYSLSGRGLWYSREPPVTHPYPHIRFVPEPEVPPPTAEQEWLFRKGGQETTYRTRVIGVYGIYVEIDPAANRVITILPYFYD